MFFCMAKCRKKLTVVWQGRQECDGTTELWVAAGGNRGILCGVKVVDTLSGCVCAMQLKVFRIPI